MVFQLNKQDKCAARIHDRQLLGPTNDTAEQTDFRTSIKALAICRVNIYDIHSMRGSNERELHCVLPLIYRTQHSFKQTIRDM